MSDPKGRLLVLRPDTHHTHCPGWPLPGLQNMRSPCGSTIASPFIEITPASPAGATRPWEAGVELLGAGGRRADIEAVALAVQAMESCLPGFRMEIGPRGLFPGLGCGAPHYRGRAGELRSTH